MKKQNIYKIFYIVSVLLVIAFCIQLPVEYYLYDGTYTSAPFYVTIIVRLIEFILPSTVLFIIGKVLKKKYNK